MKSKKNNEHKEMYNDKIDDRIILRSTVIIIYIN